MPHFLAGRQHACSDWKAASRVGASACYHSNRHHMDSKRCLRVHLAQPLFCEEESSVPHWEFWSVTLCDGRLRTSSPPDSSTILGVYYRALRGFWKSFLLAVRKNEPSCSPKSCPRVLTDCPHMDSNVPHGVLLNTQRACLEALASIPQIGQVLLFNIIWSRP